MSVLIQTSSGIGNASQLLYHAWWSYLIWIIAAGALGFATAGIFSGWLRLSRSIFLIPYAVLVVLFGYAYWQWSGISVAELVRHNWVWGVIGAVLIGVFVVRNVLSQPASPHKSGLQLIFELLWSGIVYGGMDALLLSVLPVLAAWQAFSTLGWTSSWFGAIVVGVIALLLSLFVTASYHLGFREYRRPGKSPVQQSATA